MIVSLLYLIASRPDIVFIVFHCARFPSCLKVSHITAVKRIQDILLELLFMAFGLRKGLSLIL